MLEPEVVQAVALAAAGVAALALLLALLLLVRLRRLRSALAATGPAAGPPALPPETHAAGDDALRHVAVVRDDASPGTGGQQSFSAALLDERGNGLVLTAISGRAESRTYGKAVAAGESTHVLSAEERQAIALARG